METKILTFIKILRKSGLKVSLVETLDCFRALQYINWEKSLFYLTLRSTLVKEHEFYQYFDKLFEIYFNEDFFYHKEEKRILDKLSCSSTGEPELYLKSENELEGSCSSTDSTCGKGMGGTTGQGLGSTQAGSFVETVLLGSQAQFEQLVSKSISKLGELNEKDLTNREKILRKIKVDLKWKMGEYELEKIMQGLKEVEQQKIKENLATFGASLQRLLDIALLKQFEELALEELLRNSDLNELDFFRLADNQLVEIRRKITKLAYKLATRVSRRETKAKKGSIKLSRTIRKAMTTGGVPIYPVYSGKKPSRPEFIILCDLSGSVRLFSEFMLQLVYSIQSRFVHARSFAFVDTVQEITTYFNASEINEAIRAIYYDGKFSKTGFSNYGLSFMSFNSDYLNLVTKKTTVLVLGDARNNYQPPYLEELRKIAVNAHRVIWLNPAPKATWDTEDSLMSPYQGCCDQVYECRNLRQLEKTVKKIF